MDHRLERRGRGGQGIKHRPALTILILLLLITLLGLGLRLYRLDAQSLWYDEGFSVYLARMSPGEITARTAADIQPPLYYYLLHAWIRLLGDREGALRGLSLLFGVLTIPLIYAVAWQLFRNHLAGLLAALLVATSPLHIWYGQEARMYTLLVFLCLLSSYLLLLVIQAQKKWIIGGLWCAYTIANVAALYTHYFAVFVVAFQALYLALVWWQSGSRPTHLLLGGLASWAALLLAYLPWLPHLLGRYNADVSYWLGQLRLPQVALDIALSFIGGESIQESVGVWLAAGYGLVFALCLVVLLRAGSHRPPRALTNPQYPLIFLLLYLLIPPVLILALSYNSPKFNARYVMISHPALLLILSGGLAALWHGEPLPSGGRARRLLVAVALSFLLGVSAYADYNAYTNPAFARPNFRAVARYIRRQIAPDEAIILTSGHMFPVFDYYAPGLERYLLPDSPTLDTTKTLDYSIAAELNEWLAGRGGVWVVRWQDEVVDPVGFLRALLAETGTQQPVRRNFRKVGLDHYRLPPGAVFSDQPTIARPTELNFGGRLRLIGFSPGEEGQGTLHWQALQPLDEDYRVSLVLRDPAGNIWGRWDGRPSAYLYPTDRWRAGQTVFGHYDLKLPPGTPPGDYILDAGVYTEADPAGLDVLDENGTPQGKRAPLGTVRLSPPAATAADLELPNPTPVSLAGGLALLGSELGQDSVLPGSTVPLTLLWLTESLPPQDYQVRLAITDAAGRTQQAGTYPPTSAYHPTSSWLPGQAWRTQIGFRVPVESQSGTARLSLQIVDDRGTPLGPAVDLLDLQVLPVNRGLTRPQPQVPHPAHLGKIAFLGADLAPQPVRPGEPLRVALYWEALEEMDVPYTVFVHLLDADGKLVAGHDSEPAGGTRPTTSWLPGEFVTDPHNIAVPASLPSGEYWVEVGLYDAQTPGMPRLPVLDDAGQATADHVVLGPITVS